jgi:hypothetical protein
MLRATCACLLFAVFAASPAAAQEIPVPQPARAPVWSVGPIDFSGLVDGYYSLNFDHPSSKLNSLRNFDAQANQFSLNMAKLTMEHGSNPVGFRVDVGFGKAFEMIHASDPEADLFENILQAYVTVKPAKLKGLQFDFGKFVTAAGAEVVETHTNWNYSRSLLFSWAAPYYHFGARATMPLNTHFSLGAQLVNGWNNVGDLNSGKTAGVTAALGLSKVAWYNTYYVGPEKPDFDGGVKQEGLRHLYDTVLLLTPHPEASFYVNFDYGVDKSKGLGNSRWVGIASAARLALNEWFAVSPRIEWFNDADGFNTGVAQKLKEFTCTAELKMKEGFLSRLEYRRDWSNTPFFDRGGIPASFKNQDTLLLGFVAYFGPNR